MHDTLTHNPSLRGLEHTEPPARIAEQHRYSMPLSVVPLASALPRPFG